MPCAFSTSFEVLVRLGPIECSDGVGSDEEKKAITTAIKKLQHYQKEGNNTVVAEVITESIRFEPEICVCNHGN